MAMTYSSLTGNKSTIGSIVSWVSYTKLQPTVIVDEAQALLYSLLRVREMMVDTAFTMAVNTSYQALPTGFLDPIGKINLTSINCRVGHKDSAFVKDNRSYAETSGTMGASPFATTSGSLSVNVTLAAHGFTQDSILNTSGATAFNNVTLNGTFPITAIVDANTFTIDITSLGAAPNATGSGGGSAVAYLCNNLVTGIPGCYGIWNERIYFDTAFSQASICKLQYYRSLPLLAATSNETNFLTNRYPQLMRTACVTMAADFMKDDSEYSKGLTRLTALVQRINVENDGFMRGLELDPYIP